MMGTMNPAGRGFARPLIHAERNAWAPPLAIDGGWGACRPAFSRHRSHTRDFSYRRRLSMDGDGPSEDIKADPGAGVPAISGSEPYSAATIDGKRRRDTSRAPNGVGGPVPVGTT
jgi:hypothetical protein